MEDLLAAVIKATIDRTKINPASLGDIVVGTVLGQGSQRANECRIGAFLAGMEHHITPDSMWLCARATTP